MMNKKIHILILLLALSVVSVAFVAMPIHIPNGNSPIPPLWPPVWIF